MPGGVSGGSNISSWSRVIRGLESVSGGQLEGSCPLRISKTLVMRSNSAVRVTGAECSPEDSLVKLYYEICYNLPPGDSSEN